MKEIKEKGLLKRFRNRHQTQQTARQGGYEELLSIHPIKYVGSPTV